MVCSRNKCTSPLHKQTIDATISSISIPSIIGHLIANRNFQRWPFSNTPAPFCQRASRASSLEDQSSLEADHGFDQVSLSLCPRFSHYITDARPRRCNKAGRIHGGVMGTALQTPNPRVSDVLASILHEAPVGLSALEVDSLGLQRNTARRRNGDTLCLWITNDERKREREDTWIRLWGSVQVLRPAIVFARDRCSWLFLLHT